MLLLILVVLIALYVSGMLSVNWATLSFLQLHVFVLNGHTITLLNILMAMVIVWAIESLPHVFRIIGLGLFTLWLLSTLGFIAIVWSTHFLTIAVIVLLFAAIILGN